MRLSIMIMLKVALVRDEILGMSQTELGKELGTEQMSISRLERGVGGNINIIYKLVSYLHEKGYRGEVLFAPYFSTEQLTHLIDQDPITSQYFNRLKLFAEELEGKNKEIEEKNKEDIEELKNILTIISQQS